MTLSKVENYDIFLFQIFRKLHFFWEHISVIQARKNLIYSASQNIRFEFKDLNVLFLLWQLRRLSLEQMLFGFVLTLKLKISVALFFSNLSKLNVLSTFHKVIPINIKQSLEFRLCWMKLYRSDDHYISFERYCRFNT